jgi:hypothetical protein
MSHSRPIRLAVVTFLAGIVVACSSAASSGSPAPTAPPSALPPGSTVPSTSSSPAATVGALLLKVTSEGGFIDPAATLAALPTVAVYTDGRILTPGPVDAIYPGPLLSPVAVRDVGPSGAAAILAAIKQVGLDKPASANPGIPGDAGTNVFTAVVDGTTTMSRFAGARPGQPGGPIASGAEEGAAAIALMARLLDSGETWGAPAATDTRYVPAGYRVYVAPGAPQADPQASRSPVAWPLSRPLAEFGSPADPDRGIAGLRQGVVLGADAATLGAVLERATAVTAFTSGGSSYTLSVRPLLPDEAGG